MDAQKQAVIDRLKESGDEEAASVLVTWADEWSESDTDIVNDLFDRLFKAGF